MRRRRRALLPLLGCALLQLAASASSFADERVDITATDGVQLIGHLAGGTGPGVVLVPGPARDTRTWESAAAAIAARGFRVLRVDLRGHGESEGAADPSAIDRDAEGAFRYLIGRKIRPVYLVGENESATAALTTATHVPAAGVAILGATANDRLGAASPKLGVPVISIGDLTDEAAREELMRFLSDPKGASSKAPEAR